MIHKKSILNKIDVLLFKLFSRLMCLFITLVIIFQTQAISQNIGSWTAETSFLSVNEVVKDSNGNIWGITAGGMFFVQPNGAIETITPVDGMYRLRPTAIAYEVETGLLWLGYGDGTIQSFNPTNFTFRSLNDIRRNQNFTAKAINRLKFQDGDLYAATDFGLIIIDTDRRLVLDSYVNLGRFERATAALDFTIDGTTIYVATPNGIAGGNSENGSLIEPGNWDNSDGQGQLGSLTTSVNAIEIFDGQIYAATPDGNRLFESQTWTNTTLFQGVVQKFSKTNDGQQLIAVSNTVVTLFDGVSAQVVSALNSVRFLDAYVSSQNPLELYVGSSGDGLLRYSNLNAEPEFIRPSGPAGNFFTGFSKTENIKVAGTSSAPGRFGVNLDFTGYYIYRNGQWEAYGSENNDVLASNNFNSAFVTTATSDYVFAGTWGRGIAKHNLNTNEINLYDAENSPLNAIGVGTNFVVVSGLDTDSRGDVWVTTYRSPSEGLYRYSPQLQEWDVFAYPPAVSVGTRFLNLMVDSFGQKWIGIGDSFASGRGLLVWDTTIENGPQAVRLTSNPNTGNLPDERVNAIVQDRRGEVWIGTNRGVARFIFPERVITGSNLDRQASFLINADTSAASPFLLRDVNVTAMAVNAANQKWIGTLNDGLWLIDEGGRNVLQHFTTENSPLFSNHITGLTIDDETGTVFIATNDGLLTYTDVVKRESRSMDDLFVYPNPFSYNQNSGPVYIEGLSEETTLSVITVDGRLVSRFNTRGGRAEWNVRDFNGNKVASGVYLIVANDVNGNEKGVGRIVVIR